MKYRTVFSEAVPILEKDTCAFDRLSTDVSDCRVGWEGCTLKSVTNSVNPVSNKTHIVGCRLLICKIILVAFVASFQVNLSVQRSRISVISGIFFLLYRGADKSFARPGKKQARKHVRDAREFNNIEMRAVIIFFFFPARQGAEENSHHSDRNISLFPSWSG